MEESLSTVLPSSNAAYHKQPSSSTACASSTAQASSTADDRSTADVSCQTDDIPNFLCKTFNTIDSSHKTDNASCQTDENDISHCLHTKIVNTIEAGCSQKTISSDNTDSQITDDSHYDRTYNPDLDSDMDCDFDTIIDPTEVQPVEQMTKYLVFDNQLNKLFKFCPDCGSCITSSEKHISGTLVSVSYTCLQGHNNTWYSQPLIRRMAAGNLLISAAILLSGSTYSKTAQLLNILHMPFLSKSEFYRIQNTYLNPTINDYWIMHQTAILSVLSDCDILRVCGDARSDSPGYSAKYTSYTIMDMATSLIIDQQLVSIADDKVTSSVAMEKEAVERSLDFIISCGLKINTLATDRHVGVRSLMKEKYPEINHQFDVWHFAKNITKKLHGKAQKKGATELMPWIHSINNHLYWCSRTCCGDPQLLKEKWMSCVHHVVNRHHWNGERMTQCEHEATDDTDNDTAWLTMDSDAHKALKTVVLDKRLLKDIDRLTNFCHTGELEVYHSMLLKYAPKRQHFHYGGMLARLQLAALDHNNNVDRDLTKDSTGQTLVRQVFSKPRKDWILRQVYDKKQYSYLDEILTKIVQRRLDKAISMDDTASHLTATQLKRNIATTDKPDLQHAKHHKYSRIHSNETQSTVQQTPSTNTPTNADSELTDDIDM